MFSGCIQRCVRKLRIDRNCPCYPGFLLGLFSQIEAFGLIEVCNYYQIMKATRNEKKIEKFPVKAISTMSRHFSVRVKRFCESTPYRKSMIINLSKDGISKKFRSIKYILTMRSTLLQKSDNFRYLFGLHIQIFFSLFNQNAI